MNISFIVPSWHYFHDPFRLQPYWEMYYATILKKQLSPMHNINICDLRGMGKDNFSDVVKKIPPADFYIYWIMKSGDALEIYSIVKHLKSINQDSLHIAGGTHVDMLPNECEKYFDKIITGPGEKTFFEAITDNNNAKKRYVGNYNTEPFSETDYPDRSFLKPEQVISDKMFIKYGNPKATMVYFSRGCFYRCSYCVYNVPNTLQVKSKSKMLDELKYLKDNYQIKAVLLKDEIAINPKMDLFNNQIEALGESGLMWRGQTTSIAKYEQLKLAKESGCVELSVGVETIDSGVMKIINKQWQNEKSIGEFIENAKKVGIKVKMCLIFGLPGEPRNIVEKTQNFIKKHSPDYVSLSGFCPLPGSPIFKDPKKYGIKYINNDWSKHAHLLYRFSDEEEVGIPFEYEKSAEWGPTFSRKEIMENIRTTQRWLEEESMTY